MTIGFMNEHVALFTPNRSSNSYGEETTTWDALATVWAEVRETPGTVYLAGPLPATHKKVIFRVYASDSFVRGMRATWKGLTFAVEDIITEADGRMALQAQEEES